MDNWERRVFPRGLRTPSDSVESLGKLKGPPCQRCGRVVYPTERIRLSHNLQYHPNCFRCFKCENRLNIQTFNTYKDEETTEVYCKHHVPLYPGHDAGSDHWGELGIRQALSMQHENPLFHSALDIRQQSGLSRSQQRALEKRLTYSRRICGSLSRLNRPFEDFRWSRSLSNSCETLSAFSCDDACSDIFYLSCPGYLTPQRSASPSLPIFQHNESLSRLHQPEPRSPSAQTPVSEVSVQKQTTFNDHVEVIHLSASSSDNEEQKPPSDLASPSKENPFNSIHSASSRRELSEYLSTHCSNSSDPGMASISELQAKGGIKFADDSSDDEFGAKSDSVFADTQPPTDFADTASAPTAQSAMARRNEMRLRFLRGEDCPPEIQITPPTPGAGSHPTNHWSTRAATLPHGAAPSSSAAPSQPPVELAARDASRSGNDSVSTHSATTSSSYSSSSYSDSSESDDSDSAPATVAESTKPAKTEHNSPSVKINPPGFVTGILPKPISQQIPRRPNRPPPPPPTNIPPYRLPTVPTVPVAKTASDSQPVSQGIPVKKAVTIQETLPSASKSEPTKNKPVYLETDLDAFIDPFVEEILDDPLKAPVGRIDVYQQSFTVEKKTTETVVDRKSPRGFSQKTSTTASSHTMKPIVRINTNSPSITGRSQSSDDVILTPHSSHDAFLSQQISTHDATYQPPAPQQSIVPEQPTLQTRSYPKHHNQADSSSVLQTQENRVLLNEEPNRRSIGLVSKQESFRVRMDKGPTLRKPAEPPESPQESPFLTAPSWERVHNTASDSDSSSSEVSGGACETEFHELTSLSKETDDFEHADFALTNCDFESSGPVRVASSEKDSDSGSVTGSSSGSSSSSSSSSESDSDSDSSDEDGENYYDPNFSYQKTSSLPDILDKLDGEEADEHHQSDPSPEVIKIGSIDDLMKFSVEHSHRQRIARPMAPPPPRPSARVVMPKGPARKAQGFGGGVSPLNLMNARSPRLRRKDLTNSLPVIFERSESFGETDVKQKPSIMIRNRADSRSSTSSGSSSSSSETEADSVRPGLSGPAEVPVPNVAKDSTDTSLISTVNAAGGFPSLVTAGVEVRDETLCTSLPSEFLINSRPEAEKTEMDRRGNALKPLVVDTDRVPPKGIDIPSPSSVDYEDHMTTDLDDLSPCDVPRSPAVRKMMVLQETDLDEMFQFNMNVLVPENPTETDIDHHDDSTATLSIAPEHPDDASTTSQSSDDQLGKVEPMHMENSWDREETNDIPSDIGVPTSVSEPDETCVETAQLKEAEMEDYARRSSSSAQRELAPVDQSGTDRMPNPREDQNLTVHGDHMDSSAKRLSLRAVLTQSRSAEIGGIVGDLRKYHSLKEPAKVDREDDDDETDAAPRRKGIRSLIAELERKTTTPVAADKKPKLFPKPKPRRDSGSLHRNSRGEEEKPLTFSKISLLSTARDQKEPASPSEKENTPRTEKPPASARPVLRDNLPSKSDISDPGHDKDVIGMPKSEAKPEYINDYVPALMTHVPLVAAAIPATVIDVYPVYQQKPPDQQPPPPAGDRGPPPPPILPKPTKKPPPPLKPKPKVPPKPKIQKGPTDESSMSPPILPPPLPFKNDPEVEEGNAAVPGPDMDAMKKMVDDVVRSRKPLQEDAERAEALRQEEMKRRREEERSREAAQEALRATSKYQRSNEIATSVIDMDRAIDEASTHISSIDNTLDRITGFNLHFMHTLETLPDGEVLDVDVDTRSVQTTAELDNRSRPSHVGGAGSATGALAQQSSPGHGGTTAFPVSSHITFSTTTAAAVAQRQPPAAAPGQTGANARQQQTSAADKKQPAKDSGNQKKPWEDDSLSSESSSGSSSSSYTDSSSSEESSDEEPPKVAPKQPVAPAKIASTAPAPSLPPPAPSQESKPRGPYLPKDLSDDPFRTRPVDHDKISIASSTLSQPERLRMPEKVRRFEEAINKAHGKPAPPPLPPPRNPFTAEPSPRPGDIPQYVNTSPQPAEKVRNPVPKPRGQGSSAESIESPAHDFHRPAVRRGSQHEEERREGHRSEHHHKKKKKRRSSDRDRDSDPSKGELHYASSQLDIHGRVVDDPKAGRGPHAEKMIQDAERKAEAEARATLERRKRAETQEERPRDNDNVFYENSTTLTRRRPPNHGSADNPGRSSVIYRESDEEEEELRAGADAGRFGNRMTSLFKKKKLGDKDKKHPSSKTGTMSSRGGYGESNPHRRSQSVDARTRKQRHGMGDHLKSEEEIPTGPGDRYSRARSSERRPVGQRGESTQWLPTMDDDDDDLEAEYRRRSTGDGFYAGNDRASRDRTLRDARYKAQSEDFIGHSPERPRRSKYQRNQHRESAAYFDFDEDSDSEIDSPRIERAGPDQDEYVNLPPRHGRSKSYDVLGDAKGPTRGYDESLPGRLLRGRPGKSGPGSIASSMMSVGDVRGKDLGELHRMVENYLERGRAEKLRTLLRALMIEDRDKMEHLVSGFNEDLHALLNRWSSEVGTERNTSRSDLLLSTLLLHGAGQDSGTGRRHGPGHDLHAAPSMATILRTVYMKPGDQDEPPPGMRPPPRPAPPALGKASLISDELARVDQLAQEVANYDQTTFKELIDVLTHNCQTEVEKVRALFCWLTVKDLTRLDFDPYAPPESLLGMLRAVKNGEISYHDLFRRLCHYCGIHCEIIFGYSKGAGYRPGMNLKDTRMFENQWTAVYILNSWRFVNVAWGTPRERPTNAFDNSGIRPGQRDDFYFLTDPEQHIFEHFPYQKRWQLMKRPISLEQFMNLPVLKSVFFNAGLSLKKRYNESLTTKDGRVTVRLVMPQFVGVTCSLENRADMTELKGLTLVRVMGEEVAILATPSQPGRYYLNIFVSSPDDWKDTTRTLAASFQIRCSEHNYDRLVVGRFPPVGFLGRTPASQKFGVSVVGNPDPLLVWNDKEVVRIPLAVAPGLKLMHRMKCFERHGKDSRDCQEYALIQARGKRTAYCIRCPANGYYYITLYAGLIGSKEEMTDEGLECVHSFLIDCRRPMTGAPPFPLQSSRWNGCYLVEPTHRLLEVNRKYNFRLEAPHCSTVAVVVNGRNWLDLRRNKSGVWFGKIFTGEELGELSVYGMYSSGTEPRRRSEADEHEDEFDAAEPEENYDKLLDYEIVVRRSNR